MVNVVETKRSLGYLGELKVIHIQTSATCASGHVIDLNSDVANARGQAAKTILNTVLQDDVGADKDGTWDPATGIYTMGTIVTGIHNILIFAR